MSATGRAASTPGDNSDSGVELRLPIGVEPAVKRRVAKPGPHGQSVGFGGTDVWLTPPEFFEAFGPFDLDPCAAPAPRPWPSACAHYTEAEGDGCSRPWDGFVWLNPPYGRETARWMARMAEHDNGIALLFVRPETAVWREHIWAKARTVVLLPKRVSFYRPDGSLPPASNAGAPSALIGYGAEAEERLSRRTEVTAGGTVLTDWTTFLEAS